jgi:hypothetical protein
LALVQVEKNGPSTDVLKPAAKAQRRTRIMAQMRPEICCGE